ncbi:hypothetical protein K501DRAFT_334879 [Backusella circina FSU 941]|nr:hypothetical protein K501DRAFT_334879 [Backusella circina FSU 941]
MSGITQAEKQKFAEIFQARGQINGYMQGAIARDVLLASNLPPNRLERIWDLSDIDKDGNLDFDEFCIAMHLTYDCINGAETPMYLPSSLVPVSKAHLVPQQSFATQQIGYQPTGYQQPQPTGYQPQQQQQQIGYQQTQPTGYQPQSMVMNQPTGYPPSQYGGYQEPEFSWDMTTDDMTSYQNIYSKYANDSGRVKFGRMEDFFTTLGLPRTDLTNAWKLVDVNQMNALTQDQCLMFYHILNQRTKGARVPKQLPPDLHAAFAGDYAADFGQKKTTSRKASNNKKKTSHDEVEALRRELAEVKDRTREAEKKLASSKENEEAFSSRSLRDQFQALYDYKMRQLTDQNNLDDKIRQQERDIDAARDTVRRLNRIVEDVRAKKHDLETSLEASRLEVQKSLRSFE